MWRSVSPTRAATSSHRSGAGLMGAATNTYTGSRAGQARTSRRSRLRWPANTAPRSGSVRASSSQGAGATLRLHAGSPRRSPSSLRRRRRSCAGTLPMLRPLLTASTGSARRSLVFATRLSYTLHYRRVNHVSERTKFARKGLSVSMERTGDYGVLSRPNHHHQASNSQCSCFFPRWH